jgi:predicted esterase YcpF (UPF0227 family)
MTSITHLLYLHGFRSSPQSTKARMTRAWIDEHLPEVEWRCPQLPPSPRAAMALAMAQIEGWEPATMGVIGSSLGGFYATIVAERTGCPLCGAEASIRDTEESRYLPGTRAA